MNFQHNITPEFDGCKMAKATNFSEYAFIAIGSNLPSTVGNPLQTISFAMDKLAEIGISPLLKSSIYSTSPVDSPPGTPDFLNAVVGLVPAADESPFSLLHKLQAIEQAAGRQRSSTKNEARTLDLDLILFRQEIIADPRLVIPHPRALSRRFVMQPLVEIVGRDFVFPGTDKPIGKFLDRIHEQRIKKVDKAL
jgi:2-amino-4-hydroxy-6-hydroxymethyldihydropteridine diphosphokinase